MHIHLGFVSRLSRRINRNFYLYFHLRGQILNGCHSSLAILSSPSSFFFFYRHCHCNHFFFFFKPSSHSSQVTQSDIIVVSRSLSIRKRVTWTNSRLYRSDPRKKSNGKRRCPEFSFPSYVLESNFHFLMVAFKTGNLGRTKRSEDYFTYGLIVEVLLIYNGA